MARYEHLLICKAALDMTMYFEGLVAGFSGRADAPDAGGEVGGVRPEEGYARTTGLIGSECRLMAAGRLREDDTQCLLCLT